MLLATLCHCEAMARCATRRTTRSGQERAPAEICGPTAGAGRRKVEVMGWSNERPSRATRSSLALVAGLALVVSACSGAASPAPSTGSAQPPASGQPPSSSGPTGGTVSVYGVWGGSEQDTFLAVTQPWQDENGATVQYTGTRDIAAVLQAGAASGILPDVAALS